MGGKKRQDALSNPEKEFKQIYSHYSFLFMQYLFTEKLAKCLGSNSNSY